ncbi:hypothetical protein DSOL_1273 [Desulfosporosinus metallidurans]|uniref:Uncharacterized protein n=1 Tax=Desulfosporosinus metallidurans TaxID=1888891 RepID=A0A1Q8QZQ9_9FIRM|nr:hypothetical protein DSOL_1273 [Desulfosporosinus metallidurans]
MGAVRGQKKDYKSGRTFLRNLPNQDESDGSLLGCTGYDIVKCEQIGFKIAQTGIL